MLILKIKKYYFNIFLNKKYFNKRSSQPALNAGSSLDITLLYFGLGHINVGQDSLVLFFHFLACFFNYMRGPNGF